MHTSVKGIEVKGKGRSNLLNVVTVAFNHSKEKCGYILQLQIWVNFIESRQITLTSRIQW